MSLKAICMCGYEFFAEFTRCICPKCRRDVSLIRGVVSFDDYVVILDEAMERIKESIVKHGDWHDYTDVDIHKAVSGEFNEYVAAVVEENITGKHGQIDELVDVVVTAVKGIRRLQCLQR